MCLRRISTTACRSDTKHAQFSFEKEALVPRVRSGADGEVPRRWRALGHDAHPDSGHAVRARAIRAREWGDCRQRAPRGRELEHQLHHADVPPAQHDG
eukprot:3288814-Pleurochrysis_carterae.AAC.1